MNDNPYEAPQAASSNVDDLRQRFAGNVRVMQIIVASLTLGVAIFLGVVFFAVRPDPAAAGGGPLMTYLVCGMAAAAVVARLIVPSLMTRTFRRRIAEGAWPPPEMADRYVAAPGDDPSNLCMVYQMRTIIAAALLEGAAFFAVTIYMQQRDPVTLSIAVLLTVMIALHLPTRDRVADWVERELVLLADERQAPVR